MPALRSRDAPPRTPAIRRALTTGGGIDGISCIARALPEAYRRGGGHSYGARQLHDGCCGHRKATTARQLTNERTNHRAFHHRHQRNPPPLALVMRISREKVPPESPSASIGSVQVGLCGGSAPHEPLVHSVVTSSNICAILTFNRQGLRLPKTGPNSQQKFFGGQ